MSELTLDTAIKHCLGVAEQNEISAITYKNCKEIKANMYEKLTAEKAENDCRECAADHRQLAEWLMEYKDLKAEQNDQYVFIHELISELKESKRLLKAAVEDIYKARQGCNCNICDMPPEPTERCQYENREDCQFKWRYTDEALKLLNDEK